MTNPRRPFRINVGFIVHEDVGYSHDFPFDFDRIQVADDLTLRRLQGTAQVGRTPQGLFLQGGFSAETSLECVRCLNKFERPLSWELTELYAFGPKSVSDSDLLLPEDAQIDLAPLMRDYALLEVPINPICKPECKGLCPVCGQDLNIRDCGHRPFEDESPFSALKSIL